MRDFISCLELISCMILAVIEQDFKTYLAADCQFWGLQISFDLTFLFVTQLPCELFRSLGVNLINRSLNARSIFIFCLGTYWIFCISLFIIPRQFCHRLAVDSSDFFSENCFKTSSCVRWYHVYDSFLALANALRVNNYVNIIEGTVPLLEGDGKSMNSYYHWIIKTYQEVAPRSLWLVLLVSFQLVQQGTRSP